MSINATVDGTTYEGVQTISVGGKSIALVETGTSGDVVRASWHQCPEAVRNYLAYVAEHPYSTSDWSVSYIADYAPTTPNENANTKPIGYTVDGVTFRDNEPFVATPFATANRAGTLTALDHLRWYNTYTHNARDLGGWACDGGTVKYGMLVRGGLPLAAYAAEDKALMVDKVGIRSELQLYGGSDDQYHYDEVSLWGIDWYGTDDGFLWYTLGRTDLWKYNLGVIFNSVIHDKPVYFHCGAGKDRTGTIAVMLLALLGVSQSDIDADYELTSFATGSGSGITTRTATGYKNYINALHSRTLLGGLSDSLQNRAFSFVLSLGFSAETINAFRAACIDGTPSIITPTLKTYTISKSGSNVAFGNDTASVDQYQGYEVDVTPDDGYVIESVSVTMGGIDVTDSVFSGTMTPQGSLAITTNGQHDVTDYVIAVVNVPQGITPSGTKQVSITQNGTTTEDVTNYASAQISVNVPSSSDIATELQSLGFTIVSDTVITGTRTSGNTSQAFEDAGVANGQGVLITAIDAPSTNQAIIRLVGNGSSNSCTVRRYPNDVKNGVGANVNGFLQNGIRYRVIVFTP